MSWFQYEYTENDNAKMHNKRVGVWLRPNAIGNSEIYKQAKKSNCKRFHERILRMKIDSYNKDTKLVWIEVWSKSFINFLLGKHRYNVYYITSKPDKFWVCEGDLGRGYIK